MSPKVNNGMADALSRKQMERFHQLTLEADLQPVQMSFELWQPGEQSYTVIDLAFSLNTRKVYGHVVCQFEQIMGKLWFLKSWPIPVEHRMQFCVHLKVQGLPSKSMRGQLAELAFTSRTWGVREDTDDFHMGAHPHILWLVSLLRSLW